jgi:hypothetical protein
VVRGAGVVDEEVEALGVPSSASALPHAPTKGRSADIAGVELQGDGLSPRLGDQADDLLGFARLEL